MIKTNDNYWDCECEDHYIHPKSNKKGKISICIVCNTNEDEQPDARENEVNGIYLKLMDWMLVADGKIRLVDKPK
jgi:hypothetical protein